jgi:xanthine dehydrogenase small subunit
MGADSRSDPRKIVRFILDDELVEIGESDPNRTILQYLREDRRRTGTKEGCAEGDCGACTVVIVEPDPGTGRLRAKAVNACIQFLPVLDGRELITVESLARDSLHPVQQALVEAHGSQCGFCTPGFVMALFALYKSHPDPGRRDIDDALAGNLCRCTGYSPIIIAARDMYTRVVAGDNWLSLPAGSPVSADEQRRIERLEALRSDRPLVTAGRGKRFLAPRTQAQLGQFLAANPEATLLAGGTDVALRVTKSLEDIDVIIHTGNVRELHTLGERDGCLEIGAAVSLTEAMPHLDRHFPDLAELWLRFASPPIRNVATLAGNIANASPIGDAMPALLALDTELVLNKTDTTRVVPLCDFYLSYRRTVLEAGEFISRIRIPLPEKGESLRAYKVSKRFDQDISAVCGAFRLVLDGNTVTRARIAYGGMAEIPKRATHAERMLAGAHWNEASLGRAMQALDEDFSPIADMRASAEYRRVVCRNLLRRFYLELAGSLAERVYSYGR